MHMNAVHQTSFLNLPMLSFILRRLLIAVPTWFVISVIVFALSRCTSGDAVVERLQNSSDSNSSNRLPDDIYREKAHELHLDLPVFYFTIQPAAFPDTFHKIVRRDERDALEGLLWQSGNWQAVSDFHAAVRQFYDKMSSKAAAQNLPPSGGLREENTEGSIFQNLQNDAAQLLIQHDDPTIRQHLENVKTAADSSILLRKDIENLEKCYETLQNTPTRTLLFVPKIRWHGFANQYHFWISNFLLGNFGIAKDDQSVAAKLTAPLSISFVLGLSTLILSFGIGIPTGVFAAVNARRRRGRWLVRWLFATYSVPTFWLATLAAMFFTTHFYGLKIFPSIGMADAEVGASNWAVIGASLPRFILPIICMSIHPITVIARQMQAAMADVLQKDFIQTARAKGLPLRQVIWRHAVRNALSPMATLIGQLLPTLVTGAFAVEMIFNLPGMGRMTVAALLGGEWSVVFAVVMLVSGLILLGNLLTDVLYRWLNPRISLGKS